MATFPNFSSFMGLNKSETKGLPKLTNDEIKKFNSKKLKDVVLCPEVKKDNLKKANNETSITSVLPHAEKLEKIVSVGELQCIYENLTKHKNAVTGIAHSVESEKVSVQMLRESLQGFSVTITCGKTACKNTHEIIKGLVKSTEQLVEHIQQTILCQSEVLTTSFDELNKSISTTFGISRTKCSLGKNLNSTAIICTVPHNGRKASDFSDSHEDISEEIENSIKDINEVSECSSKDTSSYYTEDKKTENLIKLSNCVNAENEQLNDKCETSSKTLTLHQTVKELEQKLKDKQREFDLLKLKQDNAYSELEDYSSKFQIEVDRYKNLQFEHDNLKQTAERLARLEKLTDQVQLHYEVKGELIIKATDELKSMLVQHMGIQRHELKFIHCPSAKDVDPDIPLMVLCINVSRIGTDVQGTLRHLKASKRVALLILHHKDVHALPSQASDRVLTGVDFQSLGGIFDLAFLTEKGLYQCDMNRKAVNGIVAFIKAK